MAKSSNYRAPVRAHKDIIDRDGGDGPALPVPPTRFVPVVRHEPMRRSTRAERYSEMSERWRDMLTNCNVPDAELTAEELRARRRKEARR